MITWPCSINVDMTPPLLRQFGPLIPAWWDHAQQSIAGDHADHRVLLDTGASGIFIDQGIADTLRLPSHGQDQVHGAHGYGELKKYKAKLILPVADKQGYCFALGMPVECAGIPHLSEKYSSMGAKVVGIIGRNFLQFCTVVIDGPQGKIHVEIDQSVQFPRD
ncbi:aspartyl protease family protein [Xanthomonas bonasiae]|uniref:aspartyl protease family protein n=1 Tax=Xanthomonas bonasiae TaxID=2810351 RepID=UPI001CD85C38|nr:hypothetical protein [Xanthomonas surreyensis]